MGSRSTFQQMLTQRLLLELAREHGRCIYNYVVDCTKVFDSVWHEWLWATLQIYRMDCKQLRIIQRLYHFAMTAVKISRKIKLVQADSGFAKGQSNITTAIPIRVGVTNGAIGGGRRN